MNNIKICDQCRGACQLLVPEHRPESAEWYCEACHKSYDAAVAPRGKVA